MSDKLIAFAVAIYVGFIIGLVFSQYVIIRPTIENIANQFCETKNMELEDYSYRNMRLEWIDCKPSYKPKIHTFEFEID